MLLELGPKSFAEWTLAQKRLLVTDTTFRDAHQSLMATRVRSFDMLAVAGAVARDVPGLFSLEMWGGATFDTAMRFLSRIRGSACASCARRSRTSVSRCCSAARTPSATRIIRTTVVAGFVKHAAASGMDIFRIFDSLNYLPNLRVAMEAVQDTHAVCEAAICYTGDILDPIARQVFAEVLRRSSRRSWSGWARISSRSRTWRGCAGPTRRTSS